MGKFHALFQAMLVEILKACFPRSQAGMRLVPRNLDPTHMEGNESVLKRRQKQVQYGKNTSGYQNYLEQVPKYDN